MSEPSHYKDCLQSACNTDLKLHHSWKNTSEKKECVFIQEKKRR